MAESRLVPCNLMAWPKVRDLLPDQKLLVYHIWATCPQACGCFLLDIGAFQAALSITGAAIVDALKEFERRKLILMDEEMGEVFITDFYRFHKFGTAARRRLLEDSLKTIQSKMLADIAGKSARCVLRECKENEGNTNNESERSESQASHSAAAGAVKYPPDTPLRRRRERPSGIICWFDADEEAAIGIETTFGQPAISKAVQSLIDQGKEPVPGRVRALLGRIVAQESKQEAERQLDALVGRVVVIDGYDSPARVLKSSSGFYGELLKGKAVIAHGQLVNYVSIGAVLPCE